MRSYGFKFERLMKGVIRFGSITLLSFLLLLPFPLYASEVTDVIKSTVDDVLKVLKDESLVGQEKTEVRRAKIRGIVKKRFDFEEMAERSLGAHWRRLTESERIEFVDLFSEFVELSYIDKIEAYNNERVVYTGEMVEGNKAVVKSMVITTQGKEIPLSYRLLRKGDWLAYDVQIEGVSLVSNYRSQFNEIIQKYSYDEVVKRLKAKVGKK